MTNLNATTADLNLTLLRTMTPAERAIGRFMRAPDGHDGGDGGSDDDAGDSGASDQGADDAGKAADDGAADDAGDKTALGSAGDEDVSGDGAGGDGEGDEGEKGEGKAGDDEGAPETYELKLTRTEKNDKGEDVEVAVDLDPVLVEKAAPVLKGLNLTNDQANQLVKLVPDIQTRLAEQQNDQFAAMRADWAKSAKADPDIGGKNWTPSLNLAAKALDHLGHPKGSEFRQLLDETGLGNHPAMVKIFRDVGKMIKEDDTLEKGDSTGKPKGDRLVELYPDDVPNAEKTK